MTSESVQVERIQSLNEQPVREGRYVLYWMQQAQRAEWNQALEYAIDQANRLHQPLVAVFGLMDDYPEANLRHYVFMLQGLAETQQRLEKRGIRLVVRQGQPASVALKLGERASVIVCDRGYLRHQRQWRREVASGARCHVVQVESDVVVPVDVVSAKAEFAARTIRPKLNAQTARFLVPVTPTRLKHESLSFGIAGLALDNVSKVTQRLKLDRSIAPVNLFTGGTSQAKKVFGRFLEGSVQNYAENRNQPQTDDVSHMGMYLHFGQISPVYLALKIQNAPNIPTECREAFLEEMIVRRELAINFVQFTENYDEFACLPPWACATLTKHKRDARPQLYTREQLEQAATHDSYWNAAMNEMRHTGYMHNYMRMYWGKKILEWSKTPEHAFQTALYLNNKYFIDGRDPNSFAGVGWTFGLHDRPWAERAVFGTVRYMAASGLERKCDIRGYVEKVKRLMKETAVSL